MKVLNRKYSRWEIYAIVPVFLFLSFTIPHHAEENDAYFIGNIPFSSVKDDSSESGYILILSRADRLYENLKNDRNYTVRKKSGGIFLSGNEYRYKTSARAELKSTFLVDYDDPIFTDIKKDIELKLKSSHPSPAELAQYTYDYIQNKNYKRMFDMASTVAGRKEGDCTEHSVLYAALLRLYGIPSRVVLGAVVFNEGFTKGSFGHAWVEFIYEERWNAYDPTLNRAVDYHYIPVQMIETEGMDFRAGMMDNFLSLPEKIIAVND